MNGRSYHYIPNSNNQKYGGIANFTYDGSYQVNQHIDYLNGSQPDSIVQAQFVRGVHIYNISDIILYIKSINQYY
jgi:hypothetical protein